MKAKLSFRLGIITGLIIFLAIGISYIAVSRQLTEKVTESARIELYRDLLLSKQILEQQPPGWQSTEQTRAAIQRIGRTLEIRVTLINLEGELLGDSSIPRETLPFVENHRQRPEVIAALDNGYGESIRFSQTVKEHALYMAVPVGLSKPCAILRFSKPLYDIELFDSALQKKIMQGIVPALLFSLAAGVLATFFLGNPLHALAETAKKIVRSDFSGSIPHIERSDELGTLARAINSMSDALTTMRQREEWYQAVFSGIREAIMVTDAAGDIILVNPAASRMFRIDGAMFKSRPIRHISDNRLQELFISVHNNRTTLRKEEMQLMTSRGERIMQISSMPLVKEKQFEGTVFVLNDITTLRNLERIRRDFVSSVSHELRTPLTVISGYTETLLDGAIDDPEHAKPFLKIILQASEQLTSLVNDVLDLSRIESGYINYQFSAVKLAEVVHKSVNLLKPSIEKKEIRLDISIPEDIQPVMADPRYLDIVIRNLLENAIKYVDARQGRIRITAFRSDNNIRLQIEDNGIGISKQDLGRIFERFYRVDKARSRQHGGTGLGLSIVKHIILAHKGDVEVRSRINHGSVFSVVLRVAECDIENNNSH